MAGLLGTSSTTLFASRLLSSSSSKLTSFAISSNPVVSGKFNWRKFYGGIGIPLKKNRSQLQFPVSNVATEIKSTERVLFVCEAEATTSRG